ncbi:gfo/Idh/MocA family oxidoreductase, partial [Listeria monocytogenes]
MCGGLNDKKGCLRMKKYQLVIVGYGGMGSYHVTLASAADNLEVH